MPDRMGGFVVAAGQRKWTSCVIEGLDRHDALSAMQFQYGVDVRAGVGC